MSAGDLQPALTLRGLAVLWDQSMNPTGSSGLPVSHPVFLPQDQAYLLSKLLINEVGAEQGMGGHQQAQGRRD